VRPGSGLSCGQHSRHTCRCQAQGYEVIINSLINVSATIHASYTNVSINSGNHSQSKLCLKYLNRFCVLFLKNLFLLILLDSGAKPRFILI
jgi:hypothetical protein